jgi:hypothetical protein
MNDIFELWSLPWHALQRSLAEAFGDQIHPESVAVLVSDLSGSQPPALQAGLTAASSWLARARSGATQAFGAGQPKAYTAGR